MSKVGKILLTLIIVLVLVMFVWYFATPKSSLSPTTYQNPPQDIVPADSQAGTPLLSEDASLDQDMSNIDSDLNSLDFDSATLDQSLNDKPIDQLQ